MTRILRLSFCYLREEFVTCGLRRLRGCVECGKSELTKCLGNVSLTYTGSFSEIASFHSFTPLNECFCAHEFFFNVLKRCFYAVESVYSTC